MNLATILMFQSSQINILLCQAKKNTIHILYNFVYFKDTFVHVLLINLHLYNQIFYELLGVQSTLAAFSIRHVSVFFPFSNRRACFAKDKCTQIYKGRFDL